MEISELIKFMMYISSIMILAGSFVFTLKSWRKIEIIDFIGIFAPVGLLLGYLLYQFSDLSTVNTSLWVTLFINSYAYVNWKLTNKMTRDVYNIANSIEKTFNKKDRAVIKQFREEKLGSVTYDSLVALGFLKPLLINRDVVIMKVKTPREGLKFRTWIKKGGRFKEHYHPDCIESVVVVKGELKCDVMGAKIKEGDCITIPSGVKHEPYATEFTELDVYFKRE